MINKLKEYALTWWEVVSAPILFFTVMEPEDWRGRPLDFLLVSSWILSFFIAVTIFVVQMIPVGQYLMEGLAGIKFLIALPVVLALGLMFSAIIFIILGGFAMFFSFGAFYLLGWVLHVISKYFNGEKSAEDMLQAVFYSSAVMLFFVVTLFLAILSNFGFLSFEIFRVGFDVVLYLSLLFIYGLWSILVRKVGGHSKPRAFLLAAIPFVFCLLLAIIFDLKGFEKIRSILGI
ncbi:MAG: YIP1 family protein [Candidatus Margulisiibacteriota bacterium]